MASKRNDRKDRKESRGKKKDYRTQKRNKVEEFFSCQKRGKGAGFGSRKRARFVQDQEF